MKKIVILLSLVAFIFSCDKTESLPTDTYEINASAKGIYNGMRAYIKIVDEKRREIVTDTAIVMNEVFSFKGKVSNSSIRILTINGVKGNLSFIFEPGKINMEIFKDSIYASVVEGSLNNEIYSQFNTGHRKKLNAIVKVRSEMTGARKAGDKSLSSKLSIQTNEMKKELNFFTHDFIKKHSDSDFSLILLESLTKGKNPDVEEFKNNLASLKKVVNKNEANKALGKKVDLFILRMEAQKNLEVGKIAPDFSSFTPDGTQLALNDIKGKATIIDFWASWCGPCRRENPNVVKVYNKYHDKGLEIISVSLDGTNRQRDPKALWLKAIEDDKLTWHHVSSLQHFNEPVARLYNVNSIPATFILDNDGRIVAKRLRGDALEKQIAELLD